LAASFSSFAAAGTSFDVGAAKLPNRLLGAGAGAGAVVGAGAVPSAGLGSAGFLKKSEVGVGIEVGCLAGSPPEGAEVGNKDGSFGPESPAGWPKRLEVGARCEVS
jgi:hypothetical protein